MHFIHAGYLAEWFDAGRHLEVELTQFARLGVSAFDPLLKTRLVHVLQRSWAGARGDERCTRLCLAVADAAGLCHHGHQWRQWVAAICRLGWRLRPVAANILRVNNVVWFINNSTWVNHIVQLLSNSTWVSNIVWFIKKLNMGKPYCLIYKQLNMGKCCQVVKFINNSTSVHDIIWITSWVDAKVGLWIFLLSGGWCLELRQGGR